ncbi:MAG TPA: hypothetical protein VMU95_26330 [Trebonia sp.]|nr:hypothetical protein [Trebonia sp.]
MGAIEGCERAGQPTLPERIIWVSYMLPAGFTVSSYSDRDRVLVEHVSSGAEATEWAARNAGARISGVVIVVAYAPTWDYDPAEILATLRESGPPPRFVIAIRENGPLFRPSHHAFTAEFRHLCGHRTTLLEEDSTDTRPALPDSGRKPGKKRGDRVESRWDAIARRAVSLAAGRAGVTLPAQDATAEEAARLVSAMRDRNSRNGQGTFGREHKRLMVALSIPGASMRSADIARELHYGERLISNSYSRIALVVQDGYSDDRTQGAADFCRRLGRDYQDWLMSFGSRHDLLPHD